MKNGGCDNPGPCYFYQKLNKPSSIDETICELHLSEGDVAKVNELMHKNLLYYVTIKEQDGPFIFNYRRFFRQMAVIYEYENK